MFMGNLLESIHVRWLSIQMHRDNGAGARCDGSLDEFWTDIVGALIGLHRYWFCSCMRHRKPGSNIGVGGDYNLVLATDPMGAKDEVQGLQAIAHSHAVLRPAVSGELLLECSYFLPEDIPARLHNAPAGSVQFLVQFHISSL